MRGETKLFIGIIVSTVVILIAAVVFANQNQKPSISSGQKVDEKYLVRKNSNSITNKSATITLVEFGDFQCPACGVYHPVVKQIIEENKTTMNFVFRNFPLSQHQNAIPAAKAAEASGKQNKYWDMYDLLYVNQNEWSSSPNAKVIFQKYAHSLGLDVEKWNKDFDDPEIQQKITDDESDGEKVGVDATPSFYLAGEKIVNPTSIEDFRSLVKAALAHVTIQTTPNESEYHAHANIKIYLSGTQIDLSQTKYQSVEGKELDEFIHLHDGNGDVVHLHKKDIPLGEFFTSLHMKLTKSCLTTEAGKEFCTDDKNVLKLYVNGKINDNFQDYKPSDLDRILLTYGIDSPETIKKQLDSVSDTACIYSEKCPERGTPPTESCVGGLGSGCDK